MFTLTKKHGTCLAKLITLPMPWLPLMWVISIKLVSYMGLTLCCFQESAG